MASPRARRDRLQRLGMIFGGMEVNIVAFAKEAGVLPYAGLILIAWSFGSLVAGAVTGAIIGGRPPSDAGIGATLLALSLLPPLSTIRSAWPCCSASAEWLLRRP